jgi:hypothetical protein
MPVHIDWDDENRRTILYTITGDWTTREFALAVQKGGEMRRTVPYELDIIFDFSRTTSIPLLWSQITQLWRNAPPWGGVLVVVSNNTALNNVIKVGVRVYPKIFGTFIVVRTLDEARARCAAERVKRTKSAAN